MASDRAHIAAYLDRGAPRLVPMPVDVEVASATVRGVALSDERWGVLFAEAHPDTTLFLRPVVGVWYAEHDGRGWTHVEGLPLPPRHGLRAGSASALVSRRGALALGRARPQRPRGSALRAHRRCVALLHGPRERRGGASGCADRCGGVGRAERPRSPDLGAQEVRASPPQGERGLAARQPRPHEGALYRDRDPEPRRHRWWGHAHVDRAARTGAREGGASASGPDGREGS